MDRGRTASKRHLICDGGGLPLAPPLLRVANLNDYGMLLPLLERVGQRRGGARLVLADRGYDARAVREGIRHAATSRGSPNAAGSVLLQRNRSAILSCATRRWERWSAPGTGSPLRGRSSPWLPARTSTSPNSPKTTVNLC